MFELLGKDAPVTQPKGDEGTSCYLRLLEESFTDYFPVKATWCESNAIPYQKYVDDW